MQTGEHPGLYAITVRHEVGSARAWVDVVGMLLLRVDSDPPDRQGQFVPSMDIVAVVLL